MAVEFRSIGEIKHNGEALQAILEEHRKWVDFSSLQGSRADLRAANLAGADLHWAKLSNADLSGADLGGANLLQASLIEASMSRADLTGANLSGANLSEANLSEAKLSEADLTRTNMGSANLQGADLSRTNLIGANLSGADLRGADLTEANLNGTDLSDAKIEGCKFGYTIFAECDLSTVIGMESAKHLAPSTIGVDTILKSKGKIPEIFLKKAGLPDIWIQYVKALTKNPIEFYSCFISHSANDQEFSDRLYTDLQAKSVRCWYFPEDATWGKSVWGEIDRAVKIYDKLVVVCSEASLKSGPVNREIERALQREDRENREVLFPIRIDNYIFDKWEHERKANVVKKVVGDFRDWKNHDAFKKNFEKLLKALNRKQP